MKMYGTFKALQKCKLYILNIDMYMDRNTSKGGSVVFQFVFKVWREGSYQLGFTVCILEMHALLQNSSVYFTIYCVCLDIRAQFIEGANIISFYDKRYTLKQ